MPRNRQDNNKRRQEAPPPTPPPSKKTKPNDNHERLVLEPNLYWDIIFRRLLKYRREHGHTLVPQRYEEDIQLGQWVKSQRKAYVKFEMRPDHLERLRRIQFAFSAIRTVKGGSHQKYKGYEYTIPSMEEEEEEEEEAAAAAGLDDGDEDGKEEHEAEASSEGSESESDCDDDDEQKHDKILYPDPAWDAIFRRLLKYRREHGDTIVPLTYKDTQLASFVRAQRKNYRNCELRPDHLDRLGRIDFAFAVNSTRNPIAAYGGSDPAYEDYAYEIPSMVEEEKGLSSDDDSEGEDDEDDEEVEAARDESDNESGSDNDADDSDRADKRLSPDPIWDAIFRRLLKYRRKHGHTCVPLKYERDIQLGRWVSNHRERYRKFLLRPDHVERLERIDFTFALSKSRYPTPVTVKGGSNPQYDGYEYEIPSMEEEETELSSDGESEEDDEEEDKQQEDDYGSDEEDEAKSESDSASEDGDASQDGSTCRLEPNEYWDAMFRRLLTYRRKHGDTLVPQRRGDFAELSAWVWYVMSARNVGVQLVAFPMYSHPCLGSRQRKAYCRFKLRPDYLERLERINFAFAVAVGPHLNPIVVKGGSDPQYDEYEYEIPSLEEDEAEHCEMDKEGASLEPQDGPADEGSENECDSLGAIAKETINDAPCDLVNMFVDDGDALMEENRNDSDSAAAALMTGPDGLVDKFDTAGDSPMDPHGNILDKEVENDPNILDDSAAGDDNKPYSSSSNILQPDPNWDASFAELLQFRHTHGHPNVKQLKCGEDAMLGQWVGLQRKSYRTFAIRPDHLERLRRIGFAFAVTKQGLPLEVNGGSDPNYEGYTYELPDDKVAMLTTNRATATHEVYRTMDEQSGFAQRPTRKAAAAASIAIRISFHVTDDIAKLNSDKEASPAGAVFYNLGTPRYQEMIAKIKALLPLAHEAATPAQVTDQRYFATMVKRLKQYVQVFGDAKVPLYFKSDTELGQWTSNQRKKLRAISLDQAQFQALVDLGFVWCLDTGRNPLPTQLDFVEGTLPPLEGTKGEHPLRRFKSSKRKHSVAMVEAQKNSTVAADAGVAGLANEPLDVTETEARQFLPHNSVSITESPGLKGISADTDIAVRRSIEIIASPAHGIALRKPIRTSDARESNVATTCVSVIPGTQEGTQEACATTADVAVCTRDLIFVAETPVTGVLTRQDDSSRLPGNVGMMEIIKPFELDLPTRTAVENAFPLRSIWATEYDNLTVLIKRLRRNILFKDYLSSPFSQRYPSCAALYKDLIKDPIHMDDITRRIQAREYESSRDVLDDFCRFFDQSLLVISQSQASNARLVFLVISHVRKYTLMLWQEYMIPSDRPLQADPSDPIFDERDADRALRLKYSSGLALPMNALAYFSNRLNSYIVSGGHLDDLDSEQLSRLVGGYGGDSLESKLKDLSSKLAGFLRQEDFMYRLGTFFQDLMQCVPKSSSHRTKITNRLTRFFWQIATPLHDASRRGMQTSSIWGDATEFLWARPTRKKLYWPALALGMLVPTEYHEPIQTIMRERNESALPKDVARRLSKRHQDRLKDVAENNAVYVLVELLGIHEFHWVRRENVQEYQPDHHPNVPSRITEQYEKMLPTAIVEMHGAMAQYDTHMNTVYD